MTLSIVRRVGVFVGLLLALLLGAPAVAQAGNCIAPGVCGVIYNQGPLTIYGYCNYGAVNSVRVEVGTTSKADCVDMDQVWVGSGQKLTDNSGYRPVVHYGPQRVKIIDAGWTRNMSLSWR